MSFQIGGSGNTYYRGDSMISHHDRANGNGSGTNFYVSGAGAKNAVWDDAANSTYARGDKSDLSKTGYDTILSHYGEIVDKSKESGGDGQSITAEGLFDFAASTTDVATQRSLILLMTNPDLLNKLDGSDHNGLIARGELEAGAAAQPEDVVKGEKNAAEFRKKLGEVANGSAIGYMDRFEAMFGGDGKNGLVGERGLWALSKLKNYPDAVKGGPNQDTAIQAYYDDLKASGLDPNKDKGFTFNKLKEILTTDDGDRKALANVSDSMNFVNAADFIYNGDANSPETQGDGPGSNRSRFKTFLSANSNAPSIQDFTDEAAGKNTTNNN